MNRRVVITGMGINSCIGNTLEEVNHSLQNGISGTRHNASYAELNFKSHVSAPADQDFDNIDRKLKRFMGVCAMYAYNAAVDAVQHAGLQVEDLAGNPRYGIVGGSGGNSTASVAEMIKLLEEKGARKIGPFFVPRNMSNTITANVGVAFKMQGIAHSITSACATSADAIGYAYNMIQLGKQDLMLAGGGEEDHWSQSLLFDAMGALSSKYNDTPEAASRPYSKDRDGFVIAGGGGFVMLESLEHAQARGANILAEVVAYAANSDGHDMVAPSGEGATRCILMALEEAKAHGVEKIDYVNTHGTSTPAGDITELKAMERAFGEGKVPALSSTKSMTGHSLGAVGVQEAIYCVLMMQNDYIAPNINVTELDEGAAGFDIVLEKRDTPLDTIMSNSFGFGGVNACLIFKKWAG
ncbi:3-oxoacyl-[acyl-carrier-protein] synthase I [Acinetobacter marinus]|uniref:3-oxoacyl-[acyl-carrier-protein] synthase 1 n=1 Tax=Acinetobacter marinus TaxID=281375 RepID=A0A1G6IX62_9GAMM|nr:beta-ketoacyl synthase N-terminal-like domain-containing protein [Acinetobacter marinus]SDC11067.1 3-oxoacyl-[acyl-carrier-protein] synthase I [Acinetobacter marinus]